MNSGKIGADGTGRDGTGREKSKVLQEVLADLKSESDDQKRVELEVLSFNQTYMKSRA